MNILVVEDAPRMAEILRRGLEEESFAVSIASDGETGLALASQGDIDLMLLDINLPGIDGFTVMQRLRAQRSDVPVIMVTARDDVADRVNGLDVGADDYVTKPFVFAELLARIRACMRRPGPRGETVLTAGTISLDPAKGTVHCNERQIQLSAREFGLLRLLMSRPGDILSRAQLYEGVWGNHYDGASNVLEVYIGYLRRKLGDGGLIETVRGRGYRLQA